MYHNNRSSGFYLNRYIFLLLAFLPSIPIMTVGVFYQPLRLDFLLMVLHALIFLTECLERKRISKFLFLFLLIGIFYIYNSRNAVTGTIQLLGYISFFASFKVGSHVYKNGLNDRRFESILYFFIYSVLVVHIFGLFGLSIDLDLGTASYKLLGMYGTFGMPFKFGLFLIVLAFLMLQKVIKITLPLVLLIVIGILSSDSRISLVCLILVLFFANARSFFSLLLLVPFTLVAATPKIASMFSNVQSISDDGSLVMRIVNLQNYMEWLTGYNFFFGQGALAYLDFGIAYGNPGPLDMALIRSFSEFGVPVTIVALIVFVCFLYKIFDFRYFMAFTIFFIVYSLFNEGIFGLRGGNFFWFALGIFYSKFLQSNTHYRLP